MTERFTVEEIRKFILSQDSLGDVLYNCNAKKIREANEVETPFDTSDMWEDEE